MRPALEELRRRLGEHGYSEEVINEIIKQIEPFVGYGFNKSHSAAYSFIAFQTAFLKCHYPIEFYTALLSVFEDSDVKVSNYVQDARRRGIEILPPDINASISDFLIQSDTQLRYGFGSIKGLGVAAIDEIIAKKPFSDLNDFIQRTTKKQVNKTSLKALVFSGCFDSLAGPVRNRMEIFQIMLHLRGDTDDLSKEIAGFTKKQMLDEEKRLLKIYMSGHPLEDIAKPTDWEAAEEGEAVITHAIVKRIKQVMTKKGKPMAFLTLEFLEKEVEAVCFPNLFAKEFAFRKGDPEITIGKALKENMIVKVKGFLQEDQSGNRNSFVWNELAIPVRVNKDKMQEILDLQSEVTVIEQKPYALPVYTQTFEEVPF